MKTGYDSDQTVDGWEWKSWGNEFGDTITLSSQWFKQYPEIDHIIYDKPWTKVYWTDGTKTEVKTHNDKYTKEYGLAMAWMRKIYGTRSAFLKAVKSGYKVYK